MAAKKKEQQFNIETRMNLMKQHDQNVGSQWRFEEDSALLFPNNASLFQISHNQTKMRLHARFIRFIFLLSLSNSFSLLLNSKLMKMNKIFIRSNCYTFNRLRWRILSKREKTHRYTYSIHRRRCRRHRIGPL